MRQLVRKRKTDESKGKHRSLLFCGDILRKLNKYRQQGQLCDVVLKVGSCEFAAHRAVLSASCAFFEGLFASGLNEKEQYRIVLEELEEDIMEDLMTYLYTGEVDLTQTNVRNILQAANFLLLTKLKEMAACFMESEINILNCVDTFQFADFFDCLDLKTEALRLIHLHLDELSRSHDFRELSAAQISQVIRCKNFAARKEELIFEVLLKWLEGDRRKEKYLPDLFSYIQFNHMERDYISSRVADSEIIKRNAELSRIIRGLTFEENDNSTSHHWKKKHIKNTNNDFGFLLEVEEQDQLVYMPEQNKWYNNVFFNVEISDAAQVLSHEDKIYIISEFSDRFECFCVSSNSLTELVPPPHSVSDCGAVIFKGCVYLVGGQDFNSTAIVQMYDPDTGKWALKSPMNQARSSHRVVTDGELLFALGGYNEKCDTLDTVEYYNSSTNSWTLLPPMGTGRVLAEAVAIGGYLLVLKGADGLFNNLSSWLIYSISDSIWYDVSLEGMSLQEKGFTVLRVKSFKDQIYLFCWVRKSGEFCFVYTCDTSSEWKISQSVVMDLFVTVHGGAIHFNRNTQQQWSLLQHGNMP